MKSISLQGGFNKTQQQPIQQGHNEGCGEMFPEHVVSRGDDVPWPTSSPDFSACDYFYKGISKLKYQSLSLVPSRN